MKKKILGLFVCIMLFSTAIPVVSSLNNRKITLTGETSDTQSFLFRKWTQIQKLLASDGFSGDHFGFCYFDDDTAVISATLDDTNGDNSGSAYVFTRSGTTWTQQGKLLALDGAAGDNFGNFISLSGDTVLIGALFDDDNGTNSGSAYVFTRSGTTWTQQGKLLALDGAAGDNFGGCLSISGDTALIGAPLDDDKGTNSGSAYVFTRSGTTWTQQAKLLASDGRSRDQFGQFVFLSGNTILIVAPFDDDKGTDSGSVYVFTRSGTTWTQQAKLLASDGAAGDNFGNFISFSDDTALIGVPNDDENGSNSGSAYVFTRSGTTWTQQAKLLALDGASGDMFGFAVSLYGDTALIGAPYDDDKGDDSGSVYVFCSNQKPNPLNINGPTYGVVGTKYTYTFNSVDPDGDDVYYYIVWNDSTVDIWNGPHASGIDANIAHTYTKKGIYTIEAKAKDAFGAESGWSTMIVNIQKSKSINRSFIQYLQNFLSSHPNLFPILKKMI